MVIIMLFLWLLVWIIQPRNLAISACLQFKQNILPRHFAIRHFVYSEVLLAVCITFFLVGCFTAWFCNRVCLPYVETIRYQMRRRVFVARISMWNVVLTIKHIFPAISVLKSGVYWGIGFDFFFEYVTFNCWPDPSSK